MTGGRWTWCSHCGSIGWVRWDHNLHEGYGQCPNPGWRGLDDERVEALREECEFLDDLEEVAAWREVEDDDPDPYSAFAYRGGNP